MTEREILDRFHDDMDAAIAATDTEIDRLKAENAALRVDIARRDHTIAQLKGREEIRRQGFGWLV